MKTYLQLVNNILIRLREREVTSIDESSYSKLIGLMVHDAVESVESAWNWSSLRQAVTITTSASTASYAITGSGDNSTIFNVINDTGNCWITYKTTDWFDNAFYTNTAPEGTPAYYTFDGLDSNGDTKIKVYPVPEGVFSIIVNIAKRAPDITADTDTLDLPFLPVQALAYAMAVEERGEDGGMSPVSAKALADNFLSNAIAIDASKHPEELIWEAL